MMLELTDFQPFALAIQREIDTPVLSCSTLLDYAYSIVAGRDFMVTFSCFEAVRANFQNSDMTKSSPYGS